MFIAFKDARIRITSIQVFHTHSTHQRYSWTKHLPTNKDLRNVFLHVLPASIATFPTCLAWLAASGLAGPSLAALPPAVGTCGANPWRRKSHGWKMSCHQWWLFIGLIFGHVWRVLVVINVYTISLDGFKWLVQIYIYIEISI